MQTVGALSLTEECHGSAALVLAPVEPAGWIGDDLIPVNGHPQLQPGVPGILLRRRPHAQPVRAAVSADADQVQGLGALPGLGCQVMLEQHERGPVLARELGPDVPGGLGDLGCGAGLGDRGQVAGLRTCGQPHTEMSDALPGRAGPIPPERLVGDQLAERRQAVRRCGRQNLRFLPTGE